MASEIVELGERARAAARRLRTVDTAAKNAALERVADLIKEQEATILDANEQDVEDAKGGGLDEHLIERLLLTPKRLEGIASDVRSVAALPDPVGETFDARTLPNGLRISRRRVPIGVIGVIYESRPNVTVDIGALCLKSGNAVILRGGKEAARSNRALADAISGGCADEVGDNAVQLVRSKERALVKEMLAAEEYIDMIIPRGGPALHRLALENATMPVITGGMGICHVYLDRSADAEKAVPIVHNSKVQRPTVCNALDVLLVHSGLAADLLPAIAERLAASGVELRCGPRALEILGGRDLVSAAGPDDFDTEFLSLVLAIRVVDSMEEALDHVEAHSTRHTDVIVTEDEIAAKRFLDEVDSAVVMANASTRFNDGAQLGLGAEVAISTQRLHARGPMALRELTTYKWVVVGEGQVRA
jgi:glutamate-5-semialdehyde dehydrogenase